MDPSLYKQHIVTRNLTYNYYLSPSTAGRSTILFLHGFPASSSDWSKQVDYFQTKGYGILVPDLLGAGKTSHPIDVSVFRMNAMAADIIDILDAEGLQKVIGVAHDWGCALLSRLSIIHEERFTGFVWLALSFIPPYPEGFNFHATMALLKEKLGYETYAYWEYLTDESSPQEIRQNIESFMQLLYPKDPWVWRTYLALPGKTAEWVQSNMRPGRPEYLTDSEFESVCANFVESGIVSPVLWYRAFMTDVNHEDDKRIPTESITIALPSLFIAASKDPICSPALGKLNMNQFGPKSTVVEFDTGHWVHLELPDTVSETINRWLKESNL